MKTELRTGETNRRLVWVIAGMLVLAALDGAIRARGGCGGGGGGGGTGGGGAAALTQQQAQNLIYLREVEKLARDVYLTMYDMWGATVFSRISMCEQRHTDAIKGLLDKYGVPDPVGHNGVGVFADPALQDLYNDLIAQGSVSLHEALKVGVMIEVLDIDDIEGMFPVFTQQDVLNVLTNLLAGSYHHLAAFSSALAM
jgi:hypothetical protein